MDLKEGALRITRTNTMISAKLGVRVTSINDLQRIFQGGNFRIPHSSALPIVFGKIEGFIRIH